MRSTMASLALTAANCVLRNHAGDSPTMSIANVPSGRDVAPPMAARVVPRYITSGSAAGISASVSSTRLAVRECRQAR